jgi:formate--tetrahydrofolate ligase
VRLAEGGSARFAPLYPDELSLGAKVEKIATGLYGAQGVRYAQAASRQLAQIEAAGYGHLPVCIAKTQYSFSTDPKLMGAPSGHTLEIGEVRLSVGAGFVVVLAGEIRTMPGLPRRPAAEGIGLDGEGRIFGLS